VYISYTSSALRGGVPLEELHLVAWSICKLSADFWPFGLELGHNSWKASSVVGKTQSYRAFGNFAMAPVGLLGALLVLNCPEKLRNAAWVRNTSIQLDDSVV
jgi:hypothetical protein